MTTVHGNGAFAPHLEDFQVWLDANMRQTSRDVPARLLTVMGFLEHLRTQTDLSANHLAASGTQLIDHNEMVQAALRRFSLTSPLIEFGRKSSFVAGWINSLVAWLKARGFESLQLTSREEFLTSAQAVASARLTTINESKPLLARFTCGTALAVIEDILDQAQAKNRAKDVAEYLVGAKLQLRFGSEVVKPKNVNTPSGTALADFRLGNAAIEVTVSPPDDRHLNQTNGILQDTGLDVWLLVRRRDRERWQATIKKKVSADRRGRVAVLCVEAFVGQNVSELGGFSSAGVLEQLARLIEIYNETWLPSAGSGGIRIATADEDTQRT